MANKSIECCGQIHCMESDEIAHKLSLVSDSIRLQASFALNVLRRI